MRLQSLALVSLYVKQMNLKIYFGREDIIDQRWRLKIGRGSASIAAKLLGPHKEKHNDFAFCNPFLLKAKKAQKPP